MRQHELKTRKPFFDDILLGLKTFEYRINDRHFSVGDQLMLKETGSDGLYTGRSFIVEVNYILKDIPELPDNYCVMSVRAI